MTSMWAQARVCSGVVLPLLIGMQSNMCWMSDLQLEYLSLQGWQDFETFVISEAANIHRSV